MKIFPAIDLYGGKAVRLYRGEYSRMTVYSEQPEKVGEDFAAAGADCVHMVDLEGAKSGELPNFQTFLRVKEKTGLFLEIGGGIRSMDAVRRYLDAGIDRVILGTAAVTDRPFLREALERYGDKIAVGADFRDGYAAIRGWTEKSECTADEFFRDMEKLGVKTVICTDVSKDGAMNGTNRELYRSLAGKYGVRITASGGVCTLDDVRALREMDLYGAIIGRAYYEGAIDLARAIEVAK